MKARRKKARCQPPWWSRAALYTAVWPRPEWYDYRLKLHREYLRRLRLKGRREANAYAFRQTLSWCWAAGWRLFRAATFLRIAG